VRSQHTRIPDPRLFKIAHSPNLRRTPSRPDCQSMSPTVPLPRPDVFQTAQICFSSPPKTLLRHDLRTQGPSQLGEPQGSLDASTYLRRQNYARTYVVPWLSRPSRWHRPHPHLAGYRPLILLVFHLLSASASTVRAASSRGPVLPAPPRSLEPSLINPSQTFDAMQKAPRLRQGASYFPLFPTPSGRDPDHGRGHARPNRAPCASDARLHPTICGTCPSNIRAPHAVRGAHAPLVGCSIRDAQQLREACGRPSQGGAGKHRHRPQRVEPHLAIETRPVRPWSVQLSRNVSYSSTENSS
jgi:hypothetical protein